MPAVVKLGEVEFTGCKFFAKEIDLDNRLLFIYVLADQIELHI